MSAAVRPSEFPPAPPLRAKSLGKIKNPRRFEARQRGVISFNRAARHVSNSKLGAFAASEETRDIEGARLKTGATVFTLAEVIFLTPLDVATTHIVDLLKQRIVELSIADDSNDSEAKLRRRLALTHLEALLATIT